MNGTLQNQQLHSATGTTVLTQTVYNLLHAVGVCARRPMIRVTLTTRNLRAGRVWDVGHVNWTRNE